MPRRTPTPLSSPAIPRRNAAPFAPPASSNGDRYESTSDAVATETAPVMHSALSNPVEVIPDAALATDDSLTSRVGEAGSDLGIEVLDSLQDLQLAAAPEQGDDAMERAGDHGIATDAGAGTGEIDRDLASEMASPDMTDTRTAAPGMEATDQQADVVTAEQPVALSWDSEEHVAPSVFEFDSYTAFASVDVATTTTDEELEEESSEVTEPAIAEAITEEMFATDTHEPSDDSSQPISNDTEHEIEHEVAAAVLHEQTADDIRDEEESKAHLTTGNPSDGTLEALKQVEPWAMTTQATEAPTAEILLAESLERIAARIRRGELSVPAGMHPETEQAALTVALLALQLSSGR
ncbi:MAG: hypothetical protein M3081_03045 [Gemmatimonadota bacterium]|nr:hypothetical protein [Gemmatimonadota bacterium]